MRLNKSLLKKHILSELWRIRNPHLQFNESVLDKGDYRIFDSNNIPKQPSSRSVNVPLPSKKAFFELVTSRNRNLINICEQHNLRNTVVVVFGMSVGSHAALTWMMESRADCIKISDPDIVDATNLNRLRFGWNDVGMYKVDLVERQLLDINPYAKVVKIKSTARRDVEGFVEAAPVANVIVDEVDDFQSKVVIRKVARKNGIPVISAADVGDNIVVDVERYDENQDMEIFLGRIPNVENMNFSKLSDREKRRLVINYVGFEKNSERMLDSLFGIKGSIVTWPQLGATATVSGGVVATIIKKLILGESVKSGRYYVSLDDIFVADYRGKINVKKRRIKIRHIKMLLDENENDNSK